MNDDKPAPEDDLRALARRLFADHGRVDFAGLSPRRPAPPKEDDE